MKLTQYTEQLQTGEEPKQTALFFGESFSGKTWAVAQLGKKYNLVWLDLEQGAVTLIAALPEEYHKNVELIQIKDTKQNPLAVKTVIKLLNAKGTVRIKEEDGSVWIPMKPGQQPKEDENIITLNPYEWGTETVLVVDSLTALGDSAMNHYLGPDGNDLSFKAKEYKHYDHQGMYLKNAMIAAQRLGCHVVFIAHQEELEQEDGTNKLTPLGGTRNFAKTIARKFDHVVHVKVHNRKHTLNSVTVKDHKVIAGSRLNVDVSSADDVPYLFQRVDNSNSAKSNKDSGSKPDLAAKLGKK